MNESIKFKSEHYYTAHCVDLQFQKTDHVLRINNIFRVNVL